MSKAFVKLNVDDKRVDILTRMDVLHDKLLEARNALNARKQRKKNQSLSQNDYIVNVLLNPKTVKTGDMSVGTEVKYCETLPTCGSQTYNNQSNKQYQQISYCHEHKNNLFGQQQRCTISQPILEDKENDDSPIKNQLLFHSPQRKVNRNASIKIFNKNDSPVKILGNRLDCEGEENLLQDDSQQNSQGSFYPLQLVSQNSLSSIPRQSYSTNKKYSSGSILSGEKLTVPTSHPRFRLSNKYLDLSGCQWESAFLQQQQVNDFDSSMRSPCQFRQISFIPSIFQKKTIRQKKKKINKVYVQISSGVRDKVANMIKDRLRFNQQLREANKKGKTAKQNHIQFLHAADLQKNLKQTVVKKVFAINHPKTGK